MNESALNQPKAALCNRGWDRTYHAASTRNDSARGIEVFKTRVIVSIDQRWAAPKQSQSRHSDPRSSGEYRANYSSRLTPQMAPSPKIIFGILSGCRWLLIDEMKGNRMPVSLYSRDQLDFGSPIPSERTVSIDY